MKKIYFIMLLVLFIFPITIFSKNNILSLIEDKGYLYYDQKYLEDKDFTIRIKQNETYKKSFTIKNDTAHSYPLFFLLESNSFEESNNNVLDYIFIDIKRDGELIYNGSASIFNYSSDSTKLHEFVSLNKFTSRSSSNIEIELKMSDDFSQYKDSYTYVTFLFYADGEDNEKLLLNPYTREMFYNYLDVWIFCLFCIFVSFIILTIIFIRKRMIKKKLKRGEKNKKESS